MKLLIKTALLAASLALGGGAIAQTPVEGSPAMPLPLCSKTVKDKCMNPSQAPRNMVAKTKHGKADHDRMRMMRKAKHHTAN